MKIYLMIQLIIGFIFMVASISCSSQKADLVFKNGVIHTVDENMSQAQAVAIAEKKIVAVGTDAEIEEFVGAGTQVIDLEGKTMTPGFIDSHEQWRGGGQRECRLNRDGTKSLQEFLPEPTAGPVESSGWAQIVNVSGSRVPSAERNRPTMSLSYPGVPVRQTKIALSCATATSGAPPMA